MKNLEEAIKAFNVGTATELKAEAYHTITTDVLSKEAAPYVQPMILQQLAPHLPELIVYMDLTKDKDLTAAILSALKITFAVGVCVGIEMEKNEAPISTATL